MKKFDLIILEGGISLNDLIDKQIAKMFNQITSKLALTFKNEQVGEVFKRQALKSFSFEVERMTKIEQQLDHLDAYSEDLKREFTGLKALVDRVTVEEEREMEDKIIKSEQKSAETFVC